MLPAMNVMKWGNNYENPVPVHHMQIGVPPPTARTPWISCWPARKAASRIYCRFAMDGWRDRLLAFIGDQPLTCPPTLPTLPGQGCLCRHVAMPICATSADLRPRKEMSSFPLMILTKHFLPPGNGMSKDWQPAS